MEDRELTTYLESSPFYAGFDLENPYTRQDFLAKFVKLSPTQKTLLTSSKTSDFIRAIGQRYNLIGQQVTLLAVIARYLVIGKLRADEVASLTAYYLNITIESATSISNDLIKIISSKPINSAPTNPAPPFPGADLPETGGNIIDLRDQN